MALFKMVNNMIAGRADISKHTNGNLFIFYGEAMRLNGIMLLWKGSNIKLPDGDRLVRCKRMSIHFAAVDAVAMVQSGFRNKNRQPVLSCQHIQALYMVRVLMRNKNGFNRLHGKLQPVHTGFRFTARDTGINQNGFLVIADIVAIAVAARIERGNKKRHV